MSKYSNWADEDSDATPIDISLVKPERRESKPQVYVSAPQAVLQLQLQPVRPTPAPLIQVPNYGTAMRPIQIVTPVLTQCSIVKGGQPEYDRFLSQYVDIAKQHGIDYSGGYDAVRDFAGPPAGAVMNHWTSTARYKNGQSDASAKGHFSGHVAKHDAALRNSEG